ncbi:MAG: cytochrome P450 [Maricaulaceae bacterium]|jgi:cytochrome P450
MKIERDASPGPACNVTLDELSIDPYPIYAQLRRDAPVAWAPRLGMWLVTRYDDIRAVLMNDAAFVTGTPQSLIYDTFGENMLTTDGDLHLRYRPPALSGALMAARVRSRFEARVASRVRQLVDSIVDLRRGDLRSLFASRLPVQVMLDVFGLPDEDEPLFRSWYDAFEAALSNHAGASDVSRRAEIAAAAFHQHFQRRLDEARARPGDNLLSDMAGQPEDVPLDDEAIRRNALIIFFGGISTVEAAILNTLWSLFRHPDAFDAVRAAPARINDALTESIRWTSPVQSATRHAIESAAIGDIEIPEGATVNCMLGAANRDEAVFENPDTFDLDRPNAAKHLGFAMGPHLCLGRHLALAEARIGLTEILARLPNLRPTRSVDLVGHEFRQPPTLEVEWT